MRYALIALLLIAPVFAHDLDGKYAQANPELHKWVENLKSKKGFCCSNADGLAVEDVDWQTQNKPDSHYKVMIDKKWLDVPDDAVITEPNRLGHAMVWPLAVPNIGLTIRCFIPGVEM